jgi:hypothetical protein
LIVSRVDGVPALPDLPANDGQQQRYERAGSSEGGLSTLTRMSAMPKRMSADPMDRARIKLE